MKNGYSIVEILVVLMIISIFSSIIIIDYGKQKSDSNLGFAIKQVAEDVRIAQSSTINTLKFNGVVPSGGYGIKFSTASNTSYILFADIDNDKVYDFGLEAVKTVTLPQGIVINSVETDLPSTGEADIVFTPPYGVIFINEKNASNNSGIIVKLTLQLKKESAACPSSDCKALEFTSEGKMTKL